MRHRDLISLVLVVGVFLLIGCSSTGDPSQPPLNSVETAVSGNAVSDNSGMKMLWGFYYIRFDADLNEFEIAPLRDAMFQANVTKFLQPPDSPINLLSIQFDMGASNIPDGLVVCDVTIRHPFVGLKKWRGFDVMGIVMGDGTYDVPENGVWPDRDELRVLNADGYTRWWNPTEFTTFGKIFGYTEGSLSKHGYYASGTINGYKYFADALSSDDDIYSLDLETRGTFSVDPGLNKRKYELQFPMNGAVPDFHFNYAITASYAAPMTNDDPEYPIDVFPSTANIAEPFMIRVIDAGSTAYYVNESTYGGDLKLDIEVFDWGLLTADDPFDQLGSAMVGGDLVGSWSYQNFSGVSFPGTSPYSRIMHFEFTDVHPKAIEGQELFIAVQSNSPTTYAPDIPGITGFDYPESATLSAYAIYEAEIANTIPQDNYPPEVGEITGPNHIFQGDDGLFTLSFATDVEDGTNLTILWDFDDDMDFDDDLDGDNGDLEGLMNFPDKGVFHIIARAVDSGGLYTDSAPYEVIVEGCPTEVHSDFADYGFNDGPPDYYIHLECAYQTVGEYAGYLLMQNKPGEIRAFDTTQPPSWTGVPYITLQNTYDDHDKLFSIDVCDFSGRVILSLMNEDDVLDPSVFRVYDVDGSYLTEISVGENREFMVADTDEDGNLYIATWENWHDDNDNHEIDEGEGMAAQIQRFVFVPDAPYYTEDTAAEYDITDQFPGNNEMWDLAISYSTDRLYALRGSYYSMPDSWAPYGELFCWDINSDGSLVFNIAIQDLDVFPTEVRGSYTTYHGCLAGGDIEIDHSWEETESCRLIVMAKKKPAAGDWGHYFIVMDTDLNQLATSMISGNTHRYSFAIKGDDYPFNREIVTPSYNNTNTIPLAPAPPGW